jgi:hypothetical protein
VTVREASGQEDIDADARENNECAQRAGSQRDDWQEGGIRETAGNAKDRVRRFEI